jgi:hypothetical protein
MINLTKIKIFFSKWFTWKIKCFIFVPLLLYFILLMYFQYGTIEILENVKVSSVNSKDGIYYIYTDQGTFKNVNSWWHLKTRSADYQGKAAPGDIATIKVYGVRSGLGSLFKNIISIEVTK